MKLLLKLAKSALYSKVDEWFEEFQHSSTAKSYKITEEQIDGVRDWVLKKVEKL